MLATATRQAARWNATSSRPVVVSVNVSARQIIPVLADDLRALLSETGLPPDRLKLEFTETAIAEDPRVVEVLQECSALGVQVWVDDFGTGFSSLAYLQKYPTQRPEARQVLRRSPRRYAPGSDSMPKAILQIADAFGLATVAEGIESEPQREQLRALGYRWGQGYLFSRPLPVAEATDRIRTLADRIAVLRRRGGVVVFHALVERPVHHAVVVHDHVKVVRRVGRRRHLE